MTTTLEKPITPFQIKRIMQNCSYQVDIKNEWVQWVTGDVNRTSLKSITHDQAIKIMLAQTGSKRLNEVEENWGFFDKENGAHMYITVLLRNADIVVKNDKHRSGEVADMEGFFHRFLQSNRCPVKKPLKKMTPREVSKIITALEGVAIWKNSI